MRQQQLQQWSRRVAIDSERERGRARERDREVEEKKKKRAKGVTSREPLHSRPPMVSSAYRRDVETDPTGIGFAYGGIYPGRLHAKGQLVQKHEVHFSVAKCGDYLLYVSLHGHAAKHGGAGNAHVPGSPFSLHVSPGTAHPLTTQIATSDLPLRGTLEAVKGERERETAAAHGATERCVCGISIAARDKMGNLCTSGGANMTCGFLEAPSTTAVAVDDASGRTQQSNLATCSDTGDGTYLVAWTVYAAGTFLVFVKIDGLHVLGSPTRMVVEPPARSAAPAPAPDPKASQSKNARRESNMMARRDSVGDALKWVALAGGADLVAAAPAASAGSPARPDVDSRGVSSAGPASRSDGFDMRAARYSVESIQSSGAISRNGALSGE